MEDNKQHNNNPAQNETTTNQNINSDSLGEKKMALDDEQRVRVLSPSMLVFKRFIRNRLAIVGTFIIIGMFLFAFLGGFISPYDESQVFMGYESMSKEYASVTTNKDFRYTIADGKEFPSAARAAMILAVNEGRDEFTAMGNTYALIKEGDMVYRISFMEKKATATTIRGITTISAADGVELSPGLKDAFETAIQGKEDAFVYEGVTYRVTGNAKESILATHDDVALASRKIFNTFAQDTEIKYEFRLAAEKAMETGVVEFVVGEDRYTLVMEEDGATVYDGEQKEYVQISDLVVQAIGTDVFLTPAFKAQVQETIANGETSFSEVNEEGEEIIYTVTRKNEQYVVRADVETQVIQIYESPSKSHWLGTDANGMDILTRLMYGGRISLIIGFIVVAIQVTLGIVLGGMAGYFGKWIDNLIMRIVDIFYCIPSLPLIIIIGSVMDQMKIDPQVRIYFMMLILGFLGWPGIARMVRGQILSLREQEFMTATEAMGISIPRRIFKHLIPNVIPQLIVMATMGLGSIILTESTLSFLGLGVKFPLASWGNIISAVSNVHVMTNYWFVWIPAGMCILLTVLAFNFIGDGLRDAFDPKMKR